MYDDNYQTAVELLQQLGLKEYEAKCYASLTRVSKATAKEVSETSDVPRTRVYDAVRVLETMGLVETQHTNPKQFRAVAAEEAANTLRKQYEDRTASLVEAVSELDPLSPGEEDDEVTHEVWALTGGDSIENRTGNLIGNAREEVVLVVGQDDVMTASLLSDLQSAQREGVDVIVGAATEPLREKLSEALSDVTVFTSGLEWLEAAFDGSAEGIDISRLLLVDESTILVSTVQAHDGESVEKAVFGRGFGNGLVVVTRRLMSWGLKSANDPGDSQR